jgi:xanthine dehydrogenase YagR molybdenum-binding subunit
VTALEVDAALAHPNVVDVFSPDNPLPVEGDPNNKQFPFSIPVEVLQDHSVRYANQPIALVIAETIEAAVEGAWLVKASYQAEAPLVGIDAEPAIDAPNGPLGRPPETTFGNIEAGLTEAITKIDRVYDSPDQYHNAMETHAIVAQWDGDKLTVDTPHQAISMSRNFYAYYFNIPPENVTVRSPYLGGGFGSKAITYSPLILAVAAARKLQCPVKLMLRRDQMFGPVAHRGGTRQQLRLGVDSRAKLTALDHVSTAIVDNFDPSTFPEPAANASQGLYAADAIRSKMRIVHNDVGSPFSTRTPGGASGSAALESAMDEMAEALNMDPLEFRLVNYAETEPGSPSPPKPCANVMPKAPSASAGRTVGWNRAR